jgi:hypothetical protein
MLSRHPNFLNLNSYFFIHPFSPISSFLLFFISAIFRASHAETSTMEKQGLSKERVTEYAEVFTGNREVNAMLDLVKHETERIESRFLEPACGNGNFLAEILQRKLRVVESRYRKSQLEYERNAVLGVSSIYGIDKLQDNVLECRQRLLGIFAEAYTRCFKSNTKAEVWDAVKFILERNIIHGDALTLQTVGPNPQPIVFSEWSFPFNNSFIKRRDFSFSDLLPSDPQARDLFSGVPLFSDSGERAFIPNELESFPPVHFLKIGQTP